MGNNEMRFIGKLCNAICCSRQEQLTRIAGYCSLVLQLCLATTVGGRCTMSTFDKNREVWRVVDGGGWCVAGGWE